MYSVGGDQTLIQGGVLADVACRFPPTYNTERLIKQTSPALLQRDSFLTAGATAATHEIDVF